MKCKTINVTLNYKPLPQAELELIECWGLFYIWSKVVKSRLFIINKETLTMEDVVEIPIFDSDR